MAELFVDSHIEDVGDIINSIHLLFVEETTSCIVETNSDTSNSASIDLDTWVLSTVAERGHNISPVHILILPQ